jgi:hypothetical protein
VGDYTLLLLPVDGRVNDDLCSGAKLSDRSPLASLLEVHAPQQVGEAGPTNHPYERQAPCGYIERSFEPEFSHKEPVEIVT